MQRIIGVTSLSAIALLASGACGGNGSSGGPLQAEGGVSGTGGGTSSASSASGGSGSSGGSSGSGGSASSGTSSSAGSCLGSSILDVLGKSRLLVGVSPTQTATYSAAPWDIVYEYISGGLFDGTTPCASCATNCTAKGHTCANSMGQGGCVWWGCYQYDMDPPGQYVTGFDTNAAKAAPKQIPMFTYYEILQTAQNTISGFQEGTQEPTVAANNVGIMTRYFNDWRFLLQQVGKTVAILHIEPDFWGYAEQAGPDPTQLSAAVATANPTDCASMPNTIAGMGKCMISMVRTYAPNALVGLHASAWASDVDVAENTSASLNVAAQAMKDATFLAAAGESEADLVIVETSDRDAGYYQTVKNENTWWDATNATLPDFHQDFAWVTALTEALNKPALYWQTPLGNKLPASNNTTNHYQDNRVDYFFGHWNEIAAAHAIGAAFGAGESEQTLPETDSMHLITLTQMYSGANGTAAGQALCP
jgi:hypothetical protein